MREFVSKAKKIKTTIGGTSYEMRCPTLGETTELGVVLGESPSDKVVEIYKDFFAKLGLPQEALMSMDNEDFTDFIGFVLTPKREGSQLAR